MAAEQAGASPQSADRPLTRIVRAAACAVPGVAGISAVDVTTSPGLRPEEAPRVGRDDTAEEPGLRVVVHLVALPVPLLPLAAAVRTAIAVAVAPTGRPVAVDVWIDALADAAGGEEAP